MQNVLFRVSEEEKAVVETEMAAYERRLHSDPHIQKRGKAPA